MNTHGPRASSARIACRVIAWSLWQARRARPELDTQYFSTFVLTSHFMPSVHRPCKIRACERRGSSHRCFRLFLSLLLFILHRRRATEHREGLNHELDFEHVRSSCVESYSRARKTSYETSGTDIAIPSPLSSALTTLDQIYILSRFECSEHFFPTLENKVTCIVGTVLDKCVPPKYIAGGQSHALRVTFSHAFIFHLALTAGYRNIAVVEADVWLRESVLNFTFTDDFATLIRSTKWSVVRFGYRPYFLQEKGTRPCPGKCRCRIPKNGKQLCKIVSHGCDLRSSDFYVVNRRVFKRLRDSMTKLRLQRQQRIVDLAPLQSLRNQWLVVPQISFQKSLDIPQLYQVGLASLYIKKCVLPKAVGSNLLDAASVKSGSCM